MKQFLNKYATFTNKSTLDTIKDTDVYAWGKAAEHAGNNDVHVDSAYKNDIKKRLEDLESIDHPEEYYNTQYIGDSTGTTIESYLKNLPNGTIAWSCNLDFFTDGNDWISKYEIGQYPTIMLKKSKDYHCFLIMFCDYKLLYWMGDTTTSITNHVWTLPIGLENNTYQINNRWLNVTGLNHSNKAHVIMGVDNEGANLELKSDNGTIYQFDTLNNGFRLYRIDEDGSNYKVLMDLADGNMLGISGSAHTATCDSDGNQISTTYRRVDSTDSITIGTVDIKKSVFNGLIRVTSPYSNMAMGDPNYGFEIALGASPRISPMVHNKLDLGSSGSAFKGIYSATGVTTVSDKNQKKDIHPLNGYICSRLIESIQAVSYKLVINDSNRTHYGMISQQVEEVLNELGIDSKDFAAFVKSPITNTKVTNKVDNDGEPILDKDGEPVIEAEEIPTGEYVYLLRYGEFIPILWKNAQDKNRKIQELEEDNQKLHQEIDELRSIVLDLSSRITNS